MAQAGVGAKGENAAMVLERGGGVGIAGGYRAMSAKKPKPDEKPQSERFIETAREIGANETKDGFQAAFQKVITYARSPLAPAKGR
jgi:hypothetical protein